MKKYEQLTWSYLKQNKKRTFSTMFGVAFAALLIFAIINITFCQIEKGLRNAEAIYKFDAVFYNLSDEQAVTIENYPGVETVYGGAAHWAFFEQYRLVFVDDFENNPYGIHLTDGHYPKDSHEILLNVTAESDYEIGATIHIGPGIQTQLEEPMEFVVTGTFVYDGKYSELSTYEYSYVSLIGLLDDNIYQQVKDTNAVFVKYSNPYRIRSLTKKINEATGATYSINDSVAVYYNQSSDGSMQGISAALVLALVILLSWMLVAVIKNTLCISVAERMKDYGILRCAGASLKHLKKMVVQEALIVGLISGVVGVLVSYIGLLIFSSNSQQYNFSHFYLLAFICTMILVLITMLLATVSPCNMLAKLTPIEAVSRQTKTSVKATYKVRKAKLITKIFGIEGAYAYKNAMRNPKQFKTIVFSLVVGIILFICTETLYETVLGYYIPDDFFNYYNVLPYDPSEHWLKNDKVETYNIYKQNMALAKAEMKGLDDVGKTVSEILIADYHDYMEDYCLFLTDTSTKFQYGRKWKGYPEDDSDIETMLHYSRSLTYKTERIFGFESKELSKFENVLIEGTCDPKELGEDGIILYNYWTDLNSSSYYTDYGIEVIDISVKKNEIYDYQIGDQLTFVTAPYEEIERRIQEREDYYHGIADTNEVLENVEDLNIECLCRLEVFQELYQEGYYKTYTIKGIVSGNPLLLAYDYHYYPHYIMTKEQMQELFDGHETMSRVVMHADGYDQDVLNILEKYGFDSYYQNCMDIYQLCDAIRTFFNMIMLVVLFFMTVNIFNTTANNMMFRKREFALLRCVGMSKKRLMYMLILEGLLAVIIAVVIGGGIGGLLCFGTYLYCSVFIKGLTVHYVSLVKLFLVAALLLAILFLASWIPLQSIKKEIAPELAQADE